jgi:hypothetical protein
MNQGIHDTRVYLDKYSHTTTNDMTVTHPTVRHMTCRIENVGHKKIYGQFFFIPNNF